MRGVDSAIMGEDSDEFSDTRIVLGFSEDGLGGCLWLDEVWFGRQE